MEIVEWHHENWDLEIWATGDIKKYDYEWRDTNVKILKHNIDLDIGIWGI